MSAHIRPIRTLMKKAPNRTVALGALTASLVVLCAGCLSKPTSRAELKPLQGHWEGEGAGGKCSITITGNSLHYRNSAGWFKTTFTLPAGTDPQELHATIIECSPPSTNAIGKVVFAIFKIEDGTLLLAEDDMSDKAPKSFAGASSRYTVRKVKKTKAEASTPK